MARPRDPVHDEVVTTASKRRWQSLWPWLGWLVSVGLGSAAVALDWRQLMPGPEDTAANLAANLALAWGYPFAGAVILTHRPGHRIGSLLCASGLASALALFTYQYATRTVILDPGSLPAGRVAAWLSSWTWALGVIPAVTLLPLLFPDGRPPSPRWWPVWSAALGATGCAVFGQALVPGPFIDFPSINNPLGVSTLAAPTAWLRALVVPLLLFAMIGSGAGIVARWRRGSSQVRQQLTWFLSATAALLVVVLFDSFGLLPAPAAPVLVFVATLLPPAAIGLAVLRYRLYDIDVVVNRSLVYVGLTGGVIGTYVTIVTFVGRLAGQLTGSVLAAAAVAAVFQPMRQRVQGGVDRLMYGDRREPHRALARLSSRLGQASSPSALLPVVAEGVSEALRVPGTRIELVRGDEVLAAAEHGRISSDIDADVFPVLYQDQLVGRMIVSRRAPGRPLPAPDRRLLDDLLWHAGLAAHVVALTSELQRSRKDVVAAAEDQRKRIRRDLHDGLGPVLAGLALGLEGAHDAVHQDGEAAEKLLAELSAQAYAAIDDVRHLVHGLRPPSLDDLGLLGAIREQANRLSVPSRELVVSVDAPDRLPPLPAAVEVAAYSIVAEALTNVSRHASAAHCTVQLRVTDVVELVIEDDGVGIGSINGHGLGLSSMAERAAELGGTCMVEPRKPSGTRVSGRLPTGPS